MEIAPFVYSHPFFPSQGSFLHFFLIPRIFFPSRLFYLFIFLPFNRTEDAIDSDDASRWKGKSPDGRLIVGKCPLSFRKTLRIEKERFTRMGSERREKSYGKCLNDEFNESPNSRIEGRTRERERHTRRGFESLRPRSHWQFLRVFG